MTYSEQLKDPRWIKKKKIILKRDNYQCTACGEKGELHVHHTYYINHLPPWMYPNGSLLTLCRSCHDNYHMTHEITIRTKHIPSFKKYKPKKTKKKPPVKRDKDISQSKVKARPNSYAWNKAVDENIKRLRKLGEET